MSDDYLNAEIGEEYKKKLRVISKKKKRSMTGQIQYWIDSNWNLNWEEELEKGDNQ
jgi:hypothetical protein